MSFSNQNMLRRHAGAPTARRARDARRGCEALRRCVAESLEARQLMTITHAAITGTGTVVEGSTYTANLSATSSNGPGAITGWSIDWGDGSTGAYPGDATSATHLYANDTPAPKPISGTVSDSASSGGTGSSLTTTSNITVTEAAPTFLAWVPGTNFEGDTVSLSHSFTDPGGDTITGYSIDWNDGTVNSSFTHTYAEESSSQGYRIGVTATTTDGGTYSSVSSFAHAHIGDLPLSTDSASFADEPVGSSFTDYIGHFTDSNPNATASDFLPPSINWGDTLTSTGSVVADSAGGFDVVGTHTYDAAGTYGVSAVVTDVGGQTTTVNQTMALPPSTVGATWKAGGVNITTIRLSLSGAGGLPKSLTVSAKLSVAPPPVGAGYVATIIDDASIEVNDRSDANVPFGGTGKIDATGATGAITVSVGTKIGQSLLDLTESGVDAYIRVIVVQ